jgi:hypothetical protein
MATRRRSLYWGGADWWALQSYPWFRYRSRYAYLWLLRKRAATDAVKGE